MRSLTLAALLSLTPVASPAEVAPARERFDQALRAGDLQAAGDAFDALAAQRKTDGNKPVPDHATSALAVRLLVATGAPYPAIGIFDQVDLATLAPADRAAVVTAAAKARLVTGDLVGAEKAASLALTLASTPVDRADAARTWIATLLATDPVRAKTTIAEQSAIRAGDRRNAWKWHVLSAQAALLTGDTPGADTAARQAWAELVDTPDAVTAPAEVAAVLATIAERRRDRGRTLAMAGVAQRGIGEHPSTIGTALWGMLPACDGTVTPDDFVTVVLHSDHEGHTVHASPVDASRPAVVARFLGDLDAQRAAPYQQIDNGALAATLRCTTARATRDLAGNPAEVEAGAWAARTGVFPLFAAREITDEAWNAAGVALDEMVARHGANSLLTLPALDRLAAIMMARSAGDPVRTAAAMEMADRAIALRATSALAPPASRQPPRIDWKAMAAATSPEAGRKLVSETLRAWLATADLRFAALALAELNDEVFTPTEVDAVLTRLAARARAELPAGDPLRRLLVVRAMRQAGAVGSSERARALARELGLPGDLCELRDTAPVLTDPGVTDDDYPLDARTAAVEGRVLVEAGLDAAGRMIAPRIVVSTANALFDTATLASVARAKSTPAQQGGRAVACRGRYHPVRWQLPTLAEETPVAAFGDPSPTD